MLWHGRCKSTRMNDLREQQAQRWMGLAVVAGSDRSVCDELRAVLPTGSRIAVVSDEHNYRQTLASVIRGGESGIIGHADPSRVGDLILLVSPLKALGSVRRVILLGQLPSAQAASISMREGITWLDASSVRAAIDEATRHFASTGQPEGPLSLLRFG